MSSIGFKIGPLRFTLTSGDVKSILKGFTKDNGEPEPKKLKGHGIHVRDLNAPSQGSIRFLIPHEGKDEVVMVKGDALLYLPGLQEAKVAGDFKPDEPAMVPVPGTTRIVKGKRISG